VLFLIAGRIGQGYFQHGNISLGHRRLPSTASQLIYSLGCDLVFVFNGEIYNYLEVRAELKNLGRDFVTTSGTEAIIAAYKQWGFYCQEKFNGMGLCPRGFSSKATLPIPESHRRESASRRPFMFGS
jgi:asparagine synthetase B (glutamine-hydrolysing)